MIGPFAKKELLSALRIKQAIASTTIASTTVNSYDASPQPAAGWDSWDGGKGLYRNMLIIANVSALNAGSITISLWDSKTAMTTNSHANETLAFTLTAITTTGPGLYVSEIRFADHIFASTIDRVVAEPLACEVMRYHSIRVTTAGGTATMGVVVVYGGNLRGFPITTGNTLLTPTFNTTTS
jgi:hypothetical protein